jgi:hypothetical protein
MTPVEIMILVGLPTLAVIGVCVYDHLRGRFTTTPDPLADLAKRLDEGVV